MKASWLAIRDACNSLTTPISGTRIVRTFGLRSHHSSFAQPKGSSLPPSGRIASRSEEHTSELQSLMRISYAVFCLKKKNKTYNTKLETEHKYTQTRIQ